MGAIRDTIYNNYLTAYAPKELTRYDTHKKSELRSVYNSIVKLNKESPWILPIANKEVQNYAVSIKENARTLHHTLASVGGLEEDSLFSKKSAYSSNPNVVGVIYIGNNASAEEVPEFEISVSSLASKQENLGSFLEDRKVSLPPDMYSFDFGINGMNYEFQFSIGENETNKEVQERLIRLMNNANIGVKASLINGEGRNAIKIVSDQSGTPLEGDRIFTITDEKTSMRKGAAEYFGLDFTSKEPSDAIFTINGEPRSSGSNHFTVERSFELTLRGINEEGDSVSVGLKTDVESLADNVASLVSGYNDFLKAATGFVESQRKSSQLIREMNSITNYYSGAMESMGLSVNEDGTLKLDRSLLSQTAYESEDIAASFKSLKSLSNSLIRKTTQVSLNPMEYVDKKIVAYKNPGKNFASPYNTSAYSGMMFNFYC